MSAKDSSVKDPGLASLDELIKAMDERIAGGVSERRRKKTAPAEETAQED